ncbi:MAG TPA: hypothetical protein VFS00_23435, partial [Polyangiaceae bacterium]|nr:hypothetical protein [Polyangiaceae bacterium]
MDDVVGHGGLGEQHVHVPGQAAGDGVNGEAYAHAAAAQDLGNLLDGVLGLGDGHAVAGHDDDVFGVEQQVGRLVDVGLGDGLLGAGLAGLAGAGGRVAEAAEDDVPDRPVHRLAHDVAENRAARADQGAGDDEQVAAEHEAGGRGRPAGVAVQHRDHDGHVAAADGGHEVPAQRERERRDDDEQPQFGVDHVPG